MLLILLAILFNTRMSLASGDSFTPAQNNKPLPTTEEVLDKYVQAIGGKVAIQAQTSRVTKGTVTVPAIGATGTIETYATSPNKTLTEITSSSFGDSRTGFNGTAAWEEEDGKVTDLTAFAKRDADFYFAIKIQVLYPKIEMKGKEKLGTRDAYRLEAPRNGNPKRWYFDAETGLLIRTEVRNAADQLISSEDYEDYRAVDGIKIAFTIRSFQDNVEAITKLSEAKHNVAIDDARFEKPTGKSASALSSAEIDAAALLKADTIRDVTTILASREMQGRGTGQPGGDRAAKYLADRLAKIGLKPGGGGSAYQQQVKFKIETILPESSLKVGNSVFKFKADFALLPRAPLESKDVAAAAVFVGYGVVSEELKRNDLAGIDINGKIVMMLHGKPKNIDAAVWDKVAAQSVITRQLVDKGAIGFITFDEQWPFALIANDMGRRRVTLADAPSTPFKVPDAIVSDNAAEKIFAANGTTFTDIRQKADAGEFVSRDLNTRVSIFPRIKREEATSTNVIGVLEGSDPKLKSEAVVFTAHYDAFGIDFDGTIHPGAADNALGVGKLVALAEAFAGMPQKPRRSIIFMSPTGEEYNDLGSEYWLQHPTWPLEKVAANITYDGIGLDVWGKLDFIMDLGYKHSNLNEVIKDVASATAIQIVPDVAPEEELFYRSDHYSFIKKGIPALFLLGGPSTVTLERAQKWETTHYHMPTDTVQADWNWEGARTLATVGLITGMRIANQESMPEWKADSPYNKPRGATATPVKQPAGPVSENTFGRIKQSGENHIGRAGNRKVESIHQKRCSAGSRSDPFPRTAQS